MNTNNRPPCREYIPKKRKEEKKQDTNKKNKNKKNKQAFNGSFLTSKSSSMWSESLAFVSLMRVSKWCSTPPTASFTLSPSTDGADADADTGDGLKIPANTSTWDCVGGVLLPPPPPPPPPPTIAEGIVINAGNAADPRALPSAAGAAAAALAPSSPSASWSFARFRIETEPGDVPVSSASRLELGSTS